MAQTTHPLRFAPWTSEVELAFYSALASLKINHDKLNSSARKVLGLYEINHKDAPERSSRMQIHGSALTADETPQGYYRAEGSIRNFNTVEEFREADKAKFVELAGRTIWDAVHDGTIYSCPSLLASFAAVCFADLKKYRFTYHFAYPVIHSEPPWRLAALEGHATGGFGKLGAKETEALVDAVQTWRYSVDSRQHGFFLAKRVRGGATQDGYLSGHGGGTSVAGEEMPPASPVSPMSSRPTSAVDLGFIWAVGSLSSYENAFYDDAEEEDRFVCFADPSTYPESPGWPLRNLLVLVRQRWRLDKVRVLCYRDTHLRRDLQNSLVLHLQAAEPSTNDGPDATNTTDITTTQPAEPTPLRSPSRTLPKITGWERNEHGKSTPRTVDLAAYLDPSRLADQAVDLNLKLIKWRIAPSIDLDAIKATSCLLLGAGTLGSYVARNLMGWGVRKITFVDNAKVSFSNPVRQPLYEFEDCLDGGVAKAEKAARALRRIYPGVEAEGHVMSVPMAGHAMVDEEKTRQEFEKLRALIESHDVVFLLMDTRESRWLPTVMAKAAGKIVINAALGFDTYMVMRHGLRPSPPTLTLTDTPESIIVEHPEEIDDPLIAAASDPITPNGHARDPSLISHNHTTPPTAPAKGTEELGCYFCSDVVAPADSLKSATLDQQCTVTRPGAAPIASALAVELLVSILQHRDQGHAPAPLPVTTASANQIQPAPPTDPTMPNSHPLGTVPHQLRGYMSTWQTLQIRGQAYDKCAACSPAILEAYERDGWEFVKRAVGERGFVEEISGLAEVQRLAEIAEREMEFERDRWGDSDEDDGDGEGEMI